MKKIRVDLKTPIIDQLTVLGIKNYLDLKYVTDLHPSREYLENVDDGKSMCNISPIEAQRKFKIGGRQGLTLLEGLALFRSNPKILESHYLDLVGSRCSGGCVPCLYVSGGKPALGHGWEGNAGPGWGAPSAGSKLALGTGELGSLGSLESRVSALEDWRAKLTEAWNNPKMENY